MAGTVPRQRRARAAPPVELRPGVRSVQGHRAVILIAALLFPRAPCSGPGPPPRTPRSTPRASEEIARSAPAPAPLPRMPATASTRSGSRSSAAASKPSRVRRSSTVPPRIAPARGGLHHHHPRPIRSGCPGAIGSASSAPLLAEVEDRPPPRARSGRRAARLAPSGSSMLVSRSSGTSPHPERDVIRAALGVRGHPPLKRSGRRPGPPCAGRWSACPPVNREHARRGSHRAQPLREISTDFFRVAGSRSGGRTPAVRAGQVFGAEVQLEVGVEGLPGCRRTSSPLGGTWSMSPS